MWKIKASIGDILLAVLFALIVYKGTGGVFLYPTELVCIFLVVLFCRSQKSQSGYFIKTHHGIFDVYFFLLLVLMMRQLSDFLQPFCVDAVFDSFYNVLLTLSIYF